MTVEAITPIAIFTVSGIGPYGIGFSYFAGSLTVVAEQGGTRTPLAPADFNAVPTASDTAGSIYLTLAAAATHAGARLIVERDTQDEQGWQGVLGERERGLERQLDRIVRAQQELRRGVNSAFRLDTPIKPGIAVPGRALIFTATGFEAGPTANEIANAQQNAAVATQAASEAASSALQAALYRGPSVDTFAELLALTSGEIDVGDYVEVKGLGVSYERVASGGDLTHADSILAWRELPNATGFAQERFGRIGDITALQNAVGTGTVKVAFWGDSITEGISQINHPDSWAGLVMRDLEAAHKDVDFVFGNFSIAGMSFAEMESATFVGAANSGAVVPFTSFWEAASPDRNGWPGGTVAGKSWKKHVEDFAPDVVIIAGGMNAGPEFITNSNIFMGFLNDILVNDVAQYAKPPSVFLVSPMLPTSNVGSGASSPVYVQAQAVGIRGMAQALDTSLIDVNARHGLLLDGANIVRPSMRRYSNFSDYADWVLAIGARPTVSAGVMTFPATGQNAVHHEIASTDFQLSGKVTLANDQIMGVRYRIHDDHSGYGYEVQFSKDGAGATKWNLYYTELAGTIALGGGSLSTASIVEFNVTVDASRHRIALNGTEVLDDQFYHWLRPGFHGLNAVGNVTVSDFVELLGQPAKVANRLYVEGDLLGRVNDFAGNPYSLGGNAINHPSVLGHRVLYREASRPLFDAFLSAQVQTKARFSVAWDVAFTPSGGPVKLTYGQTRYSNTAAMDASTGVFTAPAAGPYRFSWHIRNGAAATSSQVYLFWNNVAQYAAPATPTIAYSNASLEIILDLKKGDTIDLRVSAGTLSDDFAQNSFNGEQL